MISKSMFNTKETRLKIILISLLISAAAHAKCNVIYDIGDNLSKMEKEYGPPPPYRYPGMNIYPFFAKDICPGEGLDEGIMIEYRFVNNTLVAINFVALNQLHHLCSIPGLP